MKHVGGCFEINQFSSTCNKIKKRESLSMDVLSFYFQNSLNFFSLILKFFLFFLVCEFFDWIDIETNLIHVMNNKHTQFNYYVKCYLFIEMWII